MGADESKISIGQLRSRRDEDIPYTSYSISKPIDGDTPRASPMRGRTRNVSPQPRGRESVRNAANPGPHDIVVVAEGTTQQETDAELLHLEKIPVFVPLMRGSLNIPASSKEVDVLDNLSTDDLLLLCHRYQEHLRQCGEAVAFDQNALCVRIKEVDIMIQSIYSHLTERQCKFAKYAEQIQKVNEMSTVLNKIKMNVEQLIPVMDRLNSILPPENQLEPFSMKLKS